MNRLPISVCMVSGAEAQRIGRALESVSSWASEIIVVLNSEVTDGTEEIAGRHGARVFRESWKGFVGQKNSAAEKATQPWILNLDADEMVSPRLAQEFRALFANGSSRSGPDISDQRAEGRGQGSEGSGPVAYEFPRCSFYCGRWIRHGDWYPDRVRRLWMRGKGRWAGDEPHAHLDVTGEVGRLRSDLLHYSNESIAGQIAKIAPYHAEVVRRRVATGAPAGVFQLVVRPGWRFLRAYFFRLGFLDGWQGFYIAALSSFSTLTRHALVREARSEKAGHP